MPTWSSRAPPPVHPVSLLFLRGQHDSEKPSLAGRAANSLFLRFREDTDLGTIVDPARHPIRSKTQVNIRCRKTTQRSAEAQLGEQDEGLPGEWTLGQGAWTRA